jgi:molybdate transport system substrate-binding protein
VRKSWIALLAMLLLTGCAQARTPSVQPAAPSSEPLTVMAAASLKDAFEALGADFRAQHPATSITFNFAGSQQLAQQLVEGAPGDLFAAANQRQMDVAVAGGRVAADGADAPSIFARNRLVVVLPADNPAAIESLQDLAKPGVKLVLAAESVPAGQYALEFLANASATADYTEAYSPTVLSNVVSYETNVRSVLTKVALGEADAGIVYASDAPASNTQVATLPIPDALNVAVSYPIALVLDSTQPQAARDFVKYVLSAEGQATLARFGFLGAAEP